MCCTEAYMADTKAGGLRPMAKVMVVDDAYSELLIDRGGQLLAMDGGSQALDAVSISALAAAAFSSTAVMAQLLGETEFTVLFHDGAKRSIHVSRVEEEAILLAVFDERTTDGMVRGF